MNFKSINLPLLLTHFQGDEEILLDMVNAFEIGLDGLLNPIRDSIANQDANGLRISAHTFKGIMKSFYAEMGSRLANELEQRGNDGHFDDAHGILNQLENQLMIFLYELPFLKKDLDKIF